MKNAIKMVLAACAVFAVAGCDKLPTPEKMNSIAKLIGKTAGYVCELSSAKPEVKEAVANIVDVLAKATPKNGKTFAETWDPIIDAEIKKLVDVKKLDNWSATAVKVALTAASSGVDYVFIKYPKAKDVEELVVAAVNGFVEEFKGCCVDCTDCKDCVVGASAKKTEIDEEAYNYLKAKLSK